MLAAGDHYVRVGRRVSTCKNVQLCGEHPAGKGRFRTPVLKMPHPGFNLKLCEPVATLSGAGAEAEG
jgi:hypothetical protein